MSIEDENIALVRRYCDDLYADGRLDNPGEEYFASDFVTHDPHLGELHGYEKLVKGVEQLLQAFAIKEYRLNNVIASGDTVALHFTIRGRHSGFLLGLPPTHKEATIEGMCFMRIENGKIKETWGISDLLRTFQELEILPQVGQMGVMVG